LPLISLTSPETVRFANYWTLISYTVETPFVTAVKHILFADLRIPDDDEYHCKVYL